MPALPITPHLKQYRGSKENLRRNNSEFNARAIGVAEHINRLIANNPAKLQQYMFSSIARDLGFSVDYVRSAISDGGYNGITIGIGDEDRELLEPYRK